MSGRDWHVGCWSWEHTAGVGGMTVPRVRWLFDDPLIPLSSRIHDIHHARRIGPRVAQLAPRVMAAV